MIATTQAKDYSTIIDKKNCVLHKVRTINDMKIEHSIYRIPGHSIQRLYNVKVNGQICIAITFICDNDEYAIKQAYKQMNGLFSPQKLSTQRIKYHRYTYLNGKLDIFDANGIN